MPKVRKAELSFLYAICHLVLFYISTKYHQNILKGIQVTELTRNQFQKQTMGDNSKRKKARVVIPLCDVSSRPVPHFYQVSSKSSEGYSTYRAHCTITVKYNKGRTPKVRKSELSFLYATHRLILFCISTKYHQNIQKVERIFELQSGHKINA